MTAYKGEKQWAPCFHGPDTRPETAAYVNRVLDNEPLADDPLEACLWAVGLAWYYGETTAVDLKWGFYADQWVGVSLEIVRENEEPVFWWTEGDSFTCAVAKTIERLKEGGYWPKPDDTDDD